MLPNANRLTLFAQKRIGETYSYLGNGIHIFRKLNLIMSGDLCSGSMEEEDNGYWEPPGFQGGHSGLVNIEKSYLGL